MIFEPLYPHFVSLGEVLLWRRLGCWLRCGLGWLWVRLQAVACTGIGALGRIGNSAGIIETGLTASEDSFGCGIVDELPLVVMGLLLVDANGFLWAGAGYAYDWTDRGDATGRAGASETGA